MTFFSKASVNYEHALSIHKIQSILMRSVLH